MCGIFGFITTETYRGNGDRRKFIEQACVAGTVRGDDGAGIFMVKHKPEEKETADWIKLPGDGYSLVATADYQARLGISAKIEELRAVIGHNRSATMGMVDLANTHPFQEGPITLVHNGTLSSTWELPQSMTDLKDKEVEVDSHVITHNLAAYEDPADVIKLLDGAFTLVWHDARDQSVNIIRNDKRPLHMAPLKCEDTILIASEAEMLYWLAKRNNFQTGAIVYPKPGQLLKFLPGAKLPEVREVPLYVPRAFGRGYSNGYSSVARNSSMDGCAPWGSQAKRRVPAAAADALLQYDLEVDKQYKFAPIRIAKVHGRGTSVVSGSLSVDGCEPFAAYITGLLYMAIEKAVADNEVWTVQAQAIRHLEDTTPVVVCSLLGRTWNPVAQAEAAERALGAMSTLPRLRGVRTDEYLPGPHGEYIPAHQWLTYTADGCIQCGLELLGAEADTLEWVEGHSRPLCASCQSDRVRYQAYMD